MKCEGRTLAIDADPQGSLMAWSAGGELDGLVFIPLAAEHFDLVIPAGQAGTREVQALLKVLSSAWLLDQLASLPGYDPARCGERIATLPPRQ
jgi:molybdate-binding protein